MYRGAYEVTEPSATRGEGPPCGRCFRRAQRCLSVQQIVTDPESGKRLHQGADGESPQDGQQGFFASSEAERVGFRLLLAIKPLRGATRMISISDRVRGMTVEEAYYWFNSTITTRARRVQRVIPLLVAQE